MLTLALDEMSNEPQDLPAPVIASISAGMPISDQQRKDLTMSDVDKSLTPAPKDAPMFERGGYLNPEPSASWVASPKNENGQSKVLDTDTIWYLARMHKAAQNFQKNKRQLLDLKKQKQPSIQALMVAKNNMKTQSMRYANLTSISADRLSDRSANIDPQLLQEINKDTKALNQKMDGEFKESIKSGDLELPHMEIGRLGTYMDNAASGLKTLTNNISADATNAVKEVAKTDMAPTTL